jgi:hypothetical protein
MVGQINIMVGGSTQVKGYKEYDIGQIWAEHGELSGE